MKITRRSILKKAAKTIPGILSSPYMFGSASDNWLAGTGTQSPSQRSIATGPFAPTWESLKHYQTPDWFRDAKFGIWAHWTAQCVPEQGDWYAREMYIQGSNKYNFHVQHYGHPSRFGFMEIDNLWKADRWEPDELMRLYAKAGARFFFSLANHHDNFDCYDSRHHAWNSVRVGPKKDIVGTWAKSARQHGMRFGVSNHSAHAWHWFQTAYGYDAEGPMAGIRYDAFTLKKENGKGKWWEGLDPQELYTGPSMVIPSGLTTAQAAREWHESHDGLWTEEPPANNPAFVENWFLRCKDLLDRYEPDLVYFDNTELPLGQAGLDATAHFYNASIKKHGALEAVVFSKNLKPDHLGAVVLDIERGHASSILPAPWQTDTCIGDWHYNRSVFENHRYKTATTVIHTLIDVVSKNGNLLLSIPVRGNGTIDEDEQKVLGELGSWMLANQEAIFGTRPFAVFGEGPPEIPVSGDFSEGKARPYTAEDIRFTTKGDTLYAIALGWPKSGTLLVKTLAQGSPYFRAEVKRVELLGHGEVRFSRDPSGLNITLPESRPNEYAYTFKVSAI